MHYSQNRAFSLNFLHSSASSPFDDITKVRGRRQARECRNGGVQRMAFLLGTQSSHPKGDPALL